MVHLPCYFGTTKQVIKVPNLPPTDYFTHHVRNAILAAHPYLKKRYFLVFCYLKPIVLREGERDLFYDVDDHFPQFIIDMKNHVIDRLEVQIDRHETTFVLKTPEIIWRLMILGFLTVLSLVGSVIIFNIPLFLVFLGFLGYLSTWMLIGNDAENKRQFHIAIGALLLLVFCGGLVLGLYAAFVDEWDPLIIAVYVWCSLYFMVALELCARIVLVLFAYQRFKKDNLDAVEEDMRAMQLQQPNLHAQDAEIQLSADEEEEEEEDEPSMTEGDAGVEVEMDEYAQPDVEHDWNPDFEHHFHEEETEEDGEGEDDDREGEAALLAARDGRYVSNI